VATVIPPAGIGISVAIVAVASVVLALSVCWAANVDSKSRPLNVHALRCGRRHSDRAGDCANKT